MLLGLYGTIFSCTCRLILLLFIIVQCSVCCLFHVRLRLLIILYFYFSLFLFFYSSSVCFVVTLCIGSSAQYFSCTAKRYLRPLVLLYCIVVIIMLVCRSVHLLFSVLCSFRHLICVQYSYSRCLLASPIPFFLSLSMLLIFSSSLPLFGYSCTIITNSNKTPNISSTKLYSI